MYLKISVFLFWLQMLLFSLTNLNGEDFQAVNYPLATNGSLLIDVISCLLLTFETCACKTPVVL